MEIFYGVIVVWLMSAVALGVGASSVAISSFLVAISDGTIDTGERRMLKVVYWALRSAMIMIALLLVVLQWFWPQALMGEVYLWVLIFILYINAYLMTVHIMPASIGPALQAASWYTVGFLLTIELFNLAPLTLKLFGILYAADLIVFITVINGIMWYVRRKNVQ